jgi:hypothetical protein
MLNQLRFRLLDALGGKPKTRVSVGGGDKNYFGEQRGRNPAQLKKQRTIYGQGGIVSEALDCYPTFALKNGWRLEGENENQKDDVYTFLESFDFDLALNCAETDGVVFGDAFAENIFSVGGTLTSVVPRASDTFEIIYDRTGEIQGYVQHINDDGTDTEIPLQPRQITNYKLIGLGGSIYGYSLIQRALDDIMRDTTTVEGIATGIKRHGTPKFHVQVGMEGELIPQGVINDTKKEFQKLESKNDFVTNRDVVVNALDVGGVQNVKEYSDVSVTRMVAALGVPSELVGIRQGSTDNTAVSRIDTFMDKISWHQKRLGRCFTLNVIDRFTQEPGAVKLVLNDASPKDETAKAKWMAEIMKATSLDPFAILPRLWVQEQFNIEPDAYEDEEEELPPMMEAPEEIGEEELE